MHLAPRPELIARARAGLDLRSRDPLQYWHFAVPRLREAFSLFAAPRKPIDELHARACNKGTKSETMAAYGIALAQKRTHLDGVELPRWRGRVEGAMLVLDYPQQLLSVQPAFMRLLGRWPHHARYSGEILKSLSIMPVGGSPTDESSWSVIHFISQENRRSGLGVRADFILFDEPPRIEILRELRKAAHAGRRLVIVIGETPTIRSQWSPLRLDYGDCPRSTLRRVDEERAEVRWSLDEVAAWVLSPEEKAKLLRKYATDPLREARTHGDYIDTSGLCPFHVPTLEQMLAECTDPLEVVNWKITQEADAASGRTRITRTVPVEVWAHAAVDKSYWETIDPSSGVEDNLHDPYEIEMAMMGTGDLQARTGGYLSGYLVGVLGAGMARQYNSAPIDPEVNDRWGVNVVEGVHASRYGNFARERRELKPGEWSNEIGFHNTQKTRPLIIGAIQSWVDAHRAGIRYAKCPSRKIIETLMDCILDENGKIVGAPGVHDECLIVWGESLRRTVRRRGMDIPESNPPVKTHDQELMDRIRGKKRRSGGPGGLPLAAQRPGV
jgi:hypothetical protein